MPSTRAKVLDRVVLATPGTPSSRTCPPASRAIRNCWVTRLHADDNAADLLDDLLGEGLAVGGQFLGCVGTGNGGWGHATRWIRSKGPTSRY